LRINERIIAIMFPNAFCFYCQHLTASHFTAAHFRLPLDAPDRRILLVSVNSHQAKYYYKLCLSGLTT
jgi:thioredoxin-related protein